MYFGKPSFRVLEVPARSYGMTNYSSHNQWTKQAKSEPFFAWIEKMETYFGLRPFDSMAKNQLTQPTLTVAPPQQPMVKGL